MLFSSSNKAWLMSQMFSPLGEPKKIVANGEESRATTKPVMPSCSISAATFLMSSRGNYLWQVRSVLHFLISMTWVIWTSALTALMDLRFQISLALLLDWNTSNSQVSVLLEPSRISLEISLICILLTFQVTLISSSKILIGCRVCLLWDTLTCQV